MSVSVEPTVRLSRRLTELRREVEGGFGELLDLVGAEVETQTRRRLDEEKSSPAGGGWEPWSRRYRRTRRGGHSLLMSEGDLEDSIQHLVSGDEVAVGSNVVYAATHQFGDEGRGIPARPYLGISTSNEAELEAVIGDWLAERLSA